MKATLIETERRAVAEAVESSLPIGIALRDLFAAGCALMLRGASASEPDPASVEFFAGSKMCRTALMALSLPPSLDRRLRGMLRRGWRQPELLQDLAQVMQPHEEVSALGRIS